MRDSKKDEMAFVKAEVEMTNDCQSDWWNCSNRIENVVRGFSGDEAMNP